MPPSNQPPGESTPRLTRNIDPNEARIRVEESPRKLLCLAIIRSCSVWAKGARNIVPNITADMNNMIRDARSISSIDDARIHSVSPGRPVEALNVIILTFSARRTVVLPAKKLVMIISLRVTAFTSMLGCSAGKSSLKVPWHVVLSSSFCSRNVSSCILTLMILDRSRLV